MLTKKITYVDFDGIERTDTFYFNLTAAECAELEASGKDGLESYLRRIIASEDMGEILTIIKKVILLAYGEKTPDGRRFIKNQELRDSFAATEAYSQLFMELMSDEKAAADFMNGIAPKIKDNKTSASSAIEVQAN